MIGAKDVRWPVSAMLVLLLAGVPARAHAQVETQSRVVAGPLQIDVSTEVLDKLDLEVRTGDLSNARKTGELIIAEARKDPTHGTKEAFCSTKHYRVLVWAARDVKGALILRRLLLKPPATRPFSLDLPGIGADEKDAKLFEILIAGDKRSTLVSVYRSTRETDPLTAQVPEFVKSILTPFFGLVSVVAGELGRAERMAVSVPHLFITASQVQLPFKRASVTIKSLASLPRTQEMWDADLTRLVLDLGLDGLLDPRFARPFGDRLPAKLSLAAKTACTPGKTMEECLTELNKAVADTLKDCETTCVPGTTPTADDLKALKAVADRFRTLIRTPRVAETDFSFTNRPETHLTLGALSGVLLWGEVDRPRAKLENGSLVADPLGRLVTMAVINWAPTGYDAEAFSPTKPEVWKFFAGAILTPDFGVGVGVSVQLVRGVAFNVGYGRLYTKAVEAPVQIGKPPVDATKPFALGRAEVVFIGASYNLK
jgi:hypothetical protein